MCFEYWMLGSSYNETTRIVRCYKQHKFLVFVRDDGKECKYDLSTGEVIGFRGKPVKSLAGQLKDLTCDKLIEFIEDPLYKEYLQFVWKKHKNGKAWVFLQNSLPLFLDYEQYFATGWGNKIDRNLLYGYSVIPKGLFKLCSNYNLMLTNQLVATYIDNPNAFNFVQNESLIKCSVPQMINAMLYGCRKEKKHIIGQNINPDNLMLRNNPVLIPLDILDHDSSYFILLIKHFGYTPKLLIEYVDSNKISKKFCASIFKYIYDYADIMNQLYDSFDKYPSKITKAHRTACEEYNKISIEYDDEEYKKRTVFQYECEIDGFKFIYPKTTAEIKQEGKEQHNCVAGYINRVLSEKCHIMFMRPVQDTEHSYITLEICDNQIVQAMRKFNKLPSLQEQKVIDKWNEKYRGGKI